MDWFNFSVFGAAFALILVLLVYWYIVPYTRELERVARRAFELAEQGEEAYVVIHEFWPYLVEGDHARDFLAPIGSIVIPGRSLPLHWVYPDRVSVVSK